MGLETAPFINGLDANNPVSNDPKSQGDDHLRLIKSSIKATFPNVTGAVTVTQIDLNSVIGKGSITGQAWTGTQDFTAANIIATTPATTDNSTKAATTAYVQNALLNASLSGTLPAQSGQAGEYLFTNGTSVSWEPVFPSQTGNAGKFLSTDGAAVSWQPFPDHIFQLAGVI